MLAYSLNTEGQGGRTSMDGVDAFGFPWCVYGRAPDVESLENEFPLLIPFSQHWKDSCGHGKYRGGVGTAQLWVAYQVPEVWFSCIADNSKLQTPQPLFGGYAPCTVPGISINNADILEKLKRGDDITLDLHEILKARSIEGNWNFEFMARSVWPFKEGDVITVGFATGGAGYGDPLEREPELVVKDLKDGIISDWSAQNIYHVAYDAQRGKVDQQETEKLRNAERQARLARGRRYSEFTADWSQKRPPEEILEAYGSWPDAQPVRPVFRP